MASYRLLRSSRTSPDTSERATSQRASKVETKWDLSASEREEIGKIFPRAKHVTEVTVGRRYKATRHVGFTELPPLAIDGDEISPVLEAMRNSVMPGFATKDPSTADTVKAAFESFASGVGAVRGKPDEWAEAAQGAVTRFVEARLLTPSRLLKKQSWA